MQGDSIIERLLNRDMSLIVERGKLMAPSLGPISEQKRETDDVDVENPLTLYLIISAIQQSQFTEAIPWLLDTLLTESAYSDSYCDPEARLFMHPALPLEMVTFVVNSAPSRFSLAAVIDSLISLDSNDDVYDACRRALAVLGDTDYPSWINFANEADFQGNSMVWYFCQHQARRTAPFAPRPQYMIEFTQRSLEAVAPILDSSDPEKAIKTRTEDPELFRAWGPSNLLFGAEIEDVIDGSADLRMFVDNRFTPDEQGNWFTGSCDYCWLRIKNARYAVRKPVEAGGWRGQYCSWDCVRLDCQEYEGAAKEMTVFYEKQCSSIGIYDRLFSELGGEPDEDVMPIDRPMIVQ